MKSKLDLIPVIAAIFFLSSCEMIDDELTETVAEKLEGRWQCDETATEFKTALDFYTVDIYIHPVDDNQIVIENFYQLGWSVDVVATVNDMTLVIHEQTTTGNFTIKGTGYIASDFNKITWSYFVDDGSGIWDEVSAIYTRIE
ncbi:MAG: hypothetical protein JXB24_06055 [Bacteroidales bacterium]|nr:hypothetical protein [Bacteroidales bacterium]